MGEVDFTGILVLELFQAAARAAVAQTFPFGAGHLFQRLGFPEESLLAGNGLGWCGHGIGWFPKRGCGRPSRRWDGCRASGTAPEAEKPVGGVSPDHQNGEP